MSIIVLTGASGFVGSHVLPALLADGHRVRALVRTVDAGTRVLRRLGPGQRSLVELVHGDVTADPAALGSALGGADAVVHLVAIPRDRTGGRDLARVNTGGTAAIVEAMRASGVRRLVHLGALGVADEPSLHFASSKARGEAAVAASGLDWTILKPSLLWGERDGFFNIVAGLVRLSPGIVPVPGRGASRFQPLSADDLALVVSFVLARPDTIGRVYELGGPRIWTYREIVAEVLRGMGRRRLVVGVPLPLIRLVAGVAEAIRLPFPVATDQLRQLRLDNVAPSDGVVQSFGFEPRDMAGNLGYLRRRLRDQEPATEQDARAAGSDAPEAAADAPGATLD
jgi:NADH dehydrogenase